MRFRIVVRWWARQGRKPAPDCKCLNEPQECLWVRPATPVASGQQRSAAFFVTPVCWAPPAAMLWRAQMCRHFPGSTAPAPAYTIMGWVRPTTSATPWHAPIMRLPRSPEACLRAQTRPHPLQRSARPSGADCRAAPEPCCPFAGLRHTQADRFLSQICLAG